MRKEGFQTIKTAIRLGAIGMGIAGVLEAGEINKKQNTVEQTGQQQVEQQSSRLVFYTHDRNFTIREKVGICDPLEKLSAGRDVELVNLETNEVLLCVFPKNRQEITVNTGPIK